MKKIALVSLTSLSVLVGCNAGSNAIQQPASIAQSETIMTVNGKAIKQAEVDFIVKGSKQRNGQNIPEEMVVQELVTRELLVQEAEKLKLDKTEAVAMQLYMVNRTVLSQAAQQEYFKNNPVTDEQLKAAYDEHTGGAAGGTEYKARHILVKTEDDAKKVIAELNAGGDFATLAKTHSTGPSKTKGGDLGWFGAKQMVPPFTAGVEALADGEFTRAAVKTKFGWHIILREGSRKKTGPAFDQVKPQIQAMKQRESFQTYLEELKSGAKIVDLKKKEDVAEPPVAESAPTLSAPPAPDTTPVSEKAAATAGQVKDAAGQATQGAVNQLKGAVETAKDVVEETVK